MSSRSREKVTAALRKLFRGSDRVEPVVTDGNKVKNGNHNAEVVVESPGKSPGKRMRRQDNSKLPMKPTTASASLAQNQQQQQQQQQPQQQQQAASSPKKTNTTKKGKNQVSAESNAPDMSIRARRLMKEFTTMQKSQNNKDSVYSVELVNDNLYEWHARLHTVDSDSKLAKDMQELNIPYILLHLIFPDNFPFSPPFMRVVEPRIEKGFVMEGGAICMELLTPRGWASAYTVEALLMQFAASLVKGQARVARSPKLTKEFTRRNAEASFRSLVKTHDKYGWVTPSLSDG